MNIRPPGGRSWGWLFLALGVFIVALKNWQQSWEWLLFLLGIFFIYLALSGREADSYFPATILIVSSGALLLIDYNVVYIPLWRMWPLLFGSMGLGLAIVWSQSRAKFWMLLPAGLLLFICGAGFAYKSFWAFQHWLRRLIDLWPVLAIILGVVLLASRRRVDSSRGSEQKREIG
ncbi:MAG: hypothetical protein V2A61_01880 [Calditrichota bacterium]